MKKKHITIELDIEENQSYFFQDISRVMQKLSDNAARYFIGGDLKSIAENGKIVGTVRVV